MKAYPRCAPASAPISVPAPGAVLELLKPITWFPPLWAFACGAVSSGMISGNWAITAVRIILAGPLVRGMSQAANDWCDRHVDAINEPGRVIPSGRMPGRRGLWVAPVRTAPSLAVGCALGPWVFAAAVVGVICARACSAEPIRLKRNGWVGTAAVGLCYGGGAVVHRGRGSLARRAGRGDCGHRAALQRKRGWDHDPQ
jgi:chlorophyll synthase